MGEGTEIFLRRGREGGERERERERKEKGRKMIG